MQDILDIDFLAQIRHQQEQKRDVFLANINPTHGGTCHWDGCSERATTQCQLGKLDNVRTCRFCWHHYAEMRNFVMDLAKYEMPEQVSSAENEQKDWVCDRCKKSYRFFDVKQPVKFKDDPEERIITVCAQCHKDLQRENRVFIEYH